MSGYEVEHNIPANQPPQSERPRRPDLATFFSALEQVDTSGERQAHINAHALPTPGDVAAVYRTLANAFEVMRTEASGTREGSQGDDLLRSLVEILMHSADDPPREVQGVPDSFLDELDRVPKKELRKSDSCPICSNAFLDELSQVDATDKYPLVVRLPCHKDHKFDLECIRPWLKLNPTCPLDRKELLKKREPPPPPAEPDGEWDDMYA